MNKISVIVPVFNSEKYLKNCLDSIVNQTLKDIEIILIDDGSTDNSLEIIKQYSSLYNNIKYCSKKNEGQAIARNLGINMATGEFIAFVDSDDYIETNMFETLYNNAILNESDIVVCDYVEEYKNKIDMQKITQTEEIAGLGVKAIIDGRQVLVGNDKLMEQAKINYEKSTDIGTILYVAIDNKFAGYIVIADKIKEDAKMAIEVLKKNGIKKTVMLTGDKKQVGEHVADILGLDEVYTELLPDGKVEKVEELLKQKSEKGKLVFVGDGINDAPVLALADIGIAMGGLGSDAAIEAADVVIMTDEPSKIGNAMKISKKTMRIVRENIIFSLAVKLVVLILAAYGLSTMWAAVFADVGVSVIAILNSLRALS